MGIPGEHGLGGRAAELVPKRGYSAPWVCTAGVLVGDRVFILSQSDDRYSCTTPLEDGSKASVIQD